MPRCPEGLRILRAAVPALSALADEAAAVSTSLEGLPAHEHGDTRRLLYSLTKVLVGDLSDLRTCPTGVWAPAGSPRLTLLPVAAPDAIGLVLARPARTLGIEPFFMELIAGIEETLTDDGRSLLLHVVADHEAEVKTYRRWAAMDMVAAVVVVNITVDDHRLPVLLELGLPAVILGGPDREMGFAHVYTDNGGAVREAVDMLVGMGHTVIARVSGPGHLAHTRTRNTAFAEACASRGAQGAVVEGDYGEASGARATRALLSRATRPSVIMYDNDVMAVAGLATAQEMRVRVPEDVSLLAWDDSALCRLTTPALSAMSVDVHALGFRVADSVLNLLTEGSRAVIDAPLPELVSRGTIRPRRR